MTPLFESDGSSERLHPATGRPDRFERTMRIVIAEEELMVREALSRICANEYDCEVVGETGDGESALQLVMTTHPDFLLLDLSLPVLDGFAVARAVKRAGGNTRVIVITSSRGSYTLYRIEHGEFDGYIDRRACSLTELRAAFAACARGQRYFSSALLSEKASRLRDPKAFDKVLSDREREVLGWIGLALDDYEIGRQLGIRPRTVETFRGRILKKLGLRGTPKLIRFAIESGFVQVAARPLRA